MILRLMKRDFLWKWLPHVVLVIAAVRLFSDRNTQSLVAEAFGTQIPFFATLAGLCVLAAQQNENGYLAALPIHTRDIYLARVLSMVATIWLPLTADLAAEMQSPRVSQLPHVFASAAWTAVSTLLLVVLQTVFTRKPGYPNWMPAVAAPVLFAPFPLLYLVIGSQWQPRTVLFASVCVIAGSALLSAALCYRTWETIMPSFQLAPRRERSFSGRSAATSTRPARPWLPLLRSVYPWLYLLWLPLLGFQTTFQPGFIACVYVASAFTITRRPSRWLMTLPIGRRYLLLATLAPLLVALNAGYFIRVNLLQAGQRQRIVVTQQACGKPGFTMPSGFWKPVPDVPGKSPVVQAPWGESFHPPVATIGGRSLYNPYAVSCENSQRFITWQFDRAYAANSAPPPFRIQIVNAAALVGMALFIALLVLLNDWYPMRRLQPAVRITILVTIGVAWFGCIILDLFSKARIAENVIVSISVALSGYWLLLAIVPLAALYWLVDKVFREGEYADNPPAGAFATFD